MIQKAFTQGGFWTGLTGLLAGVSGFFALVLLLQTLLLSGAAQVQVETVESSDTAAELQQVELNQGELESYASILASPLFFPDRLLPEIVGVEEGEAETEVVDEQVHELDARLSGVIVTPDRRVAMVTDGKTRKTTMMREGMSLDGDQAAWQLSEIGSRSVSFAAGELTAELELKVNTRGLQAPSSGGANREGTVNRTANNRSVTPANNNSPAANSAAEVRRRIAERRARLREARERQQANKEE